MSATDPAIDLRGLARPHRDAHRRHHRRAAGGARRHARPRRPAAGAGQRRAAALALALLPADGAPERARARRPSAPRRLPAAGAAAAPHVGRRPARVRTQPLRVGDVATRALAHRRRRAQERAHAAPLVFVIVRHEISTARPWRCSEEHDIVYRDAAGAGQRRAAARRRRRADETFAREIVARRRAAVPLLGAHLQRPPHPLRPPLRHRGRGLPGPGRARPADRDAAARPAAARARPTRGRHALRLQGRAARCSTCIRSSVCGRRRRRAPLRALGAQTTKAGWRCRPAPRSPDAPTTTNPAMLRARARRATRTSATRCAPCARSSPTSYHREVDAQRGYPEAFVDALTKAGWLAALIPQEYGGSGLGLAEASVIMEEINRSGGNAGACHGQMYNMGTLLRHGSRRAEAALPAEDRQRRAAPAVDGRDRADHRHRHHEDQDHRRQAGRPLRRQRPEGLDLAHPALRPDDPAGAHHAAGRGEEEDRGHVDLHRRPAPGRWQAA